MKQLADFPRIPLGILPTPLYKLENISHIYGKNIYIKRDDLTGVALGGNKVRKLEFLLADAKEKGADTVLTTGGAQSNHAMLTAACANRLGMKAILVLKKRGIWERKGNQLLNAILGADVRFVDTDRYENVYAEMAVIMEGLEKEGHRAYSIPVGGSVPLGSLGYVRCAKEIFEQAEGMGFSVNHILCCTGSGGTHAGMALGAKLFSPETVVTGVAVDDDPFEEIVPRLMRETAALLERTLFLADSDVNLKYMVGSGYAIPSPEGNAAIRLMAKEEGLILDPVYTGKAFAGFLALLQEGYFEEDANIVFLHSGGAGGLFAMDMA